MAIPAVGLTTASTANVAPYHSFSPVLSSPD